MKPKQKPCICEGRKKGEPHTNRECPAVRKPQRQPSYQERAAKNPDYVRKANASVRRIKHVRFRAAYDRLVAERRENEGAALLEELLAKSNRPAISNA